MKKFTVQDALELGKTLGIDWGACGYTPEEFAEGLNIELEHGLVDPATNVTGDDALMTAKIAKAHLNENPLYYNEDVGLEAWEHALDKLKGDPKGKKVTIG
ncbi:MAG TPA: hypothetical protein PL044_09185 [Clostridiales bacterium]|nr:MAG: hypothetical protein BWY37_01871 [Firmicutes bacterium ADurb.Bin262]HOU09543.1 hypothetical protein [Clostridiales bacterium]HQH63668.1 hypothetical protein [Clostridiales bacterium]HQK73925.1 hypothetical protein [Clostridiales bacterium]